MRHSNASPMTTGISASILHPPADKSNVRPCPSRCPPEKVLRNCAVNRGCARFSILMLLRPSRGDAKQRTPVPPVVGAPGFADARGYAITSSLRTITCARGGSADSRPHHVRHKRAALSRTRRCRVASSLLPCQPNNSSQLWLAFRRALGCIRPCLAHHNALQLSLLRRDGP